MANKIRKLGAKRIVGVALIAAALVVGGIGLRYILNDAGEKEEADAVIEEIAQEVVSEPEEDDPFGVDANLLRSIDFDSLTAQNSDATRWMYVPGTAIDAPVMQEQTVGRYYYDLRGLNKSYNGCGSFLVPAEPLDEDTGEPADDARLFILGHRMNSYNGEWQFSNLPTRWGTAQGAADYPYVYIYYADHSERWRVWCAVDAWASDSIYDIPYELGSDDYAEMLEHVESMARYQMTEAPDKDTRTLMLSTCNRPTGGALMRFVLVLVPDAEYYYETGTYVDKTDERAYADWVETVSAIRDEAIEDKRHSELLDGGAGLSQGSDETSE